MIKILLLIDYSSEFSRSLLRGIINYSKKYEKWIFYRLPSYYKTLYGKEGIVKLAREWEANAIIAQWDSEGTTLLQDLKIPVVLQNFKERSDYFSNLTGSYFATGVLAAQFFLERKFRNFAFFGNNGVIWSQERGEGFKSEVEKNGGVFYSFKTDMLSDERWGSGHDELNKWLQSLPKPIALFACDDSFALQVSEVCRMHNIDIPNDIALLGVDNDELLCNLSDPPISSIVLDVEKGGYETARLLHRMIETGNNEPFNIVVNPIRIETRRSTERYVILNSHINTVVKYIEKHFTENICISDLVNLVPISRRILEIKFKQEMGTPIYQFILKCRIEEVASLLVSSDKTLFDIVLQSGFSDYKNISRVFKKFKHCTPNEYRQQFHCKKR